MPELGLAEAVSALRAELEESITKAATAPGAVRFRLGTVDIEFKIGVEVKAEGRAGVKFWVLDLGATGSRASSTTHTVKLQLHPESTSGSEVYTGDGLDSFPAMP